MENQNQLLPKPLDTQNQSIQTFEAESPICDQPNSRDSLVSFMVGKWVEVRRSLLQMTDSLLPNEDSMIEEAREMKRLLTVYSRLTPKQFSEAIRKAARDKARWLSENPNGFPKLYCYDIEEELQAAGRELLKAKPVTLALESNTAGNPFFGEPSDALAREWPKIYANTVGMRTQHVNGAKGWADYRDRFWLGGSAQQQAAALTMLRQMVIDMNDAEQWDLKKNQWEAVCLFQKEYREKFTHPNDIGAMDDLICPLDVLQIEEKRSKLAARLAYRQVKEVGYSTMNDFPDLENAKKCAVFDAYMKFWEGKEVENAD